ncbi:hypothetical protein C1E24_08625 [Pseudoalteromonas phenolica]|uniref:Uncharacterized protein n=1 Tax=Pseudoalteromonas phenolica TaxID=161398 RepID=A0A5R9Q4G6_9GAMM|nr:hypothetical protein [Pseudoalteromonas phenolica]TLX47406.1 hypothetical protein C1E24_08625 [Pseudoalteromonas phenolica]
MNRILKILAVLLLLFAVAPSSAEQIARVQNNVQSQTSYQSLFEVGDEFLSQQQSQKHHITTDDSGLFSIIERPSQQQAIRFLHPKQQSEFILVFELMLDTYISENRLQTDKLEQPWYQCNTRPNHGFIDACKPANLVYKAQLTYHA